MVRFRSAGVGGVHVRCFRTNISSPILVAESGGHTGATLSSQYPVRPAWGPGMPHAMYPSPKVAGCAATGAVPFAIDTASLENYKIKKPLHRSSGCSRRYADTFEHRA